LTAVQGRRRAVRHRGRSRPVMAYDRCGRGVGGGRDRGAV